MRNRCCRGLRWLTAIKSQKPERFLTSTGTLSATAVDPLFLRDGYTCRSKGRYPVRSPTDFRGDIYKHLIKRFGGIQLTSSITFLRQRGQRNVTWTFGRAPTVKKKKKKKICRNMKGMNGHIYYYTFGEPHKLLTGFIIFYSWSYTRGDCGMEWRQQHAHLILQHA